MLGCYQRLLGSPSENPIGLYWGFVYATNLLHSLAKENKKKIKKDLLDKSGFQNPIELGEQLLSFYLFSFTNERCVPSMSGWVVLEESKVLDYGCFKF